MPMSSTVTPLPKSVSAAGAADPLSRSIVLLGLLMVGQRLIGFGRAFFVCRVLSPADVGQLDLSLGVLALAAPLVVLGIPGSFGRYIVQFQLRGQQSTFLRRTAFSCGLLSLVGAGSLYVWRGSLSEVIYGDRRSAELLGLLAFGLPAVVFFNFACCWFSGLRLNRIVVRLQFAQSVFFAALSAYLLLATSPSAGDVIMAYLMACLLACLLGWDYLRLSTKNGKHGSTDSAAVPIWNRIIPFALWIWASNLFVNLFAICDRLLIVNFADVSSVTARQWVGQYHSARILPVLLVAVGGMVGSMLTPYLSHDWEHGRRDRVFVTLNVGLKSMAIFGYGVSLCVLLLAPYLFSNLWQEKFASGEKLLPLTLTYCNWAALTLVAQKYFWCLEKTWLSSTAMLVGLFVNAGIGFLLLPHFGVGGVVVSTMAAHCCVLATVCLCCHLFGMRLDRGVFWLAGFCPLLCFGTGAAVAGMVALFMLVAFSEQILNAADKAILRAVVSGRWQRIRAWILISEGEH